MNNQISEKRYSICIEDCKLEIFLFPSEAESYSLIDNMLHTHSFAELFCCFNGSIQINLPGNKIILNKNDVAIIPCSLTHTKYTYSSENATWESLGLISSKINNAREVSKGLYSEIAPILYGDEILICRDNAEFCSSLQKIKKNHGESTLSLLEFAYNFYKISKDKNTENILYNHKNNTNNIDRLILIDRILNTEYMHDFQNQEIADRLNLSKRQFSRFVLKNYGSSFHELIKKRRLYAASAQLTDTDFSIENICYRVGFSNKTAFYNYFRREFGVTPAEFRKNTYGKKSPSSAAIIE